LKILQVIPYFFVDWAGGKKGKPVETAFGLSKALVNMGHGVFIYTTDAFNKTEKVSKCRISDLFGINVHEFNCFGNRGGVFNICISTAMVIKLRNEVKTFDLIHLHEYPTFQNTVVHHYAMKHHIPYLLQSHGSLTKLDGPKGFKWLIRSLYDVFFGKKLLRDASRVIASSRIEAEQFKNMGVDKDKIEIIPNGIDISEFENLPLRGEFRTKWGIEDKQKVILFLARINIIKRPDLLAKAFSKLLNEGYNVHLIIAGPDDGYLATLKELVGKMGIEKNVLFTGPLYGRRKLEAYVDADVYVLPSSYEAFGITVLEACACGIPIIVTNKCGIADQISNESGLVISYNENALCEAIKMLLRDCNLRDKISRNGKTLVHKKFNWPIVAGEIEGIYKNILLK